MFKKSLIFFFFSSNFFSYSIDDFLNPDFIFSSDDLICASLEENFAAIKIPSRFEQNQLKNFRITEKIIEKVCTQNIDKQISLDLKIQSEIGLLSFSSTTLDLKVYIFYLKEALTPYLLKRDFKSADFLYQRFKQDLLRMQKEFQLPIVSFTNSFFNMANNFVDTLNWDLHSRCMEDLEEILIDFLENDDFRSEFDSFQTTSMQLKKARFDKLFSYSSKGNNEKMLTTIKTISDVYLYDPNLQLDKIVYKEFEKKNKVINLVISLEDLETIATTFIVFHNDQVAVPEIEYDIFRNLVLNLLKNFPKARTEYFIYLTSLKLNDLKISKYKDFNQILDSKACIAFKSLEISENFVESLGKYDFQNLASLELMCGKLDGFALNKTYNNKIPENYKPEFVGTLLNAVSLSNLVKINMLLQQENTNEFNPSKVSEFSQYLTEQTIGILNLLEDNQEFGRHHFILLSSSYSILNPWSLGRYLSKDQSRFIEETIQRKIFFNEEQLNRAIKDLNSFFQVKISALHLSLFFESYISFLNAQSMRDDKSYDFEKLDSFKNRYLSEKLFSLMPKTVQNKLDIFIKESLPIVENILNRLKNLNPYRLSNLFLDEPPPIMLNKYFENAEQKNMRLWYVFLKQVAYETPNLKSKKLVEHGALYENYNVLLNYFANKSVSRVSYAFLFQSLKNRLSNFSLNYVSDYYEALKKYTNYKDSLINLNPEDFGKSILDRTELSNLTLDAITKSKILLSLRDQNGKEVFKETDLLHKPIDISSIQSLLNENEVIVQFERSNFAPGLNFIISKNDYKVLTGFNSFLSSEIIDGLLSEIKIASSKPLAKFDNYFSAQLFKNTLGTMQYLNESFEDKKITIYIVASEFFKDVPFAALFDESSKSFAFENFNFIYLDSMYSLDSIKNKSPMKLDRTKKFLGFGDPKLGGKNNDTNFKNLFSNQRGVNYALENLSRLPETSDELELLSGNFDNSFIYLQDEATEKNLDSKKVKNQLKEADIISFATHAFSDVTNFTREHGLVLSPPNSFEEKYDGFLRSQEIAELDINDAIVILSACNTNYPIYINAPNFSGLPRSFIEAGARGVIYTNWNIDSMSAKIFTSEAVSLAVKNNLDISSALSFTMKKFSEGEFGEQYKHPYYWAPYQILGSN